MVIKYIPDIINSHISYLDNDKNGNSSEKVSAIYNSLKKLLNGNYERYIFNNQSFDLMLDDKLSEIEFHSLLSTLNEKELGRKTNGVYYTPIDVTSFIIRNCFNQQINKFNGELISNIDEISKIFIDENKMSDLVFKKTVFDPTCGTGEFLINAFDIKIDLLKNSGIPITCKDYIEILSTINGNDINIESVEITKIRLFFKTIKHIADLTQFTKVSEVLNTNFRNIDFLDSGDVFGKFDIIIGNPPYVEDSKVEKLPDTRYGNIYANVLQNSIDLLKDGGTLGFIIPISYISTPRMKRIRSYIEENTTTQIILSYADRPDCLFSSVHQKLNILIANKGKSGHRLFTSGYHYWYKSERNDLFININVYENPNKQVEFYPKIGNQIELDIYEKVFTNSNKNIYDTANKYYEKDVYLNMRACFWIKAFSFNPGSKEYKKFSFVDEQLRDFVLCLLNSSLFFWFWITISDCWHITKKELDSFYIPPQETNLDVFTNLARKLENRLETTKIFIGSKQTDYEYKHKECKDIIDEIDDNISKIYKLTNEELDYIKNYAIKYRKSRGT